MRLPELEGDYETVKELVKIRGYKSISHMADAEGIIIIVTNRPGKQSTKTYKPAWTIKSAA